LVAATLRAALLVAAEGSAALGLLSGSVTVLMEGVLHAMFMTKLKVGGAFLLAAVVLTTGTGVIIRHQQLAAQQPAKAKVEQPKLDAAKKREEALKAFLEDQPPNSEPPPLPNLSEDKVKALFAGLQAGEKLNTLLKEQYKAAETETRGRWLGFMAGRQTLDILLTASLRLLQAELDLSDKRPDHLVALEAHWQRMKDAELVNQVKYDAGRVAIQDYSQARFYRIRAEIWLEQVKAGQAVNSDKERDILSQSNRRGY
jgi:hypothetical protein